MKKSNMIRDIIELLDEEKYDIAIDMIEEMKTLKFKKKDK